MTAFDHALIRATHRERQERLLRSKRWSENQPTRRRAARYPH